MQARPGQAPHAAHGCGLRHPCPACAVALWKAPHSPLREVRLGRQNSEGKFCPGISLCAFVRGKLQKRGALAEQTRDWSPDDEQAPWNRAGGREPAGQEATRRALPRRAVPHPRLTRAPLGAGGRGGGGGGENPYFLDDDYGAEARLSPFDGARCACAALRLCGNAGARSINSHSKYYFCKDRFNND